MQLSLVLVSVLGFAGPPRSLWRLTADAEVIVVARVADVQKVSDEFDDTRVTLEINNVLKGSAGATITVRLSPHMSCPPPPSYPGGRTVIAFLNRDAPNDGYSTMGWDSTRIINSEAELKQLRVMVALAAHAQRVGTPQARRHWALQAFKYKATRRDGLEEIGAVSPSGFSWFDPKSAASLSPEEFALLEAQFVADPSIDETFEQTLELFDGRESVALTTTASDVIETLLTTNERPPWFDRALTLEEARLEHRDIDTPRIAPGRPTPEARWAELKTRFALKPHILEPLRREIAP